MKVFDCFEITYSVQSAQNFVGESNIRLLNQKLLQGYTPACLRIVEISKIGHFISGLSACFVCACWDNLGCDYTVTFHEQVKDERHGNHEAGDEFRINQQGRRFPDDLR